MAKIKSKLAEELRGSLSQGKSQIPVTARTNKLGKVTLSSSTAPGPSNTPDQETWRTYYATCVDVWNAMTPEGKEVYAAAAKAAGITKYNAFISACLLGAVVIEVIQPDPTKLKAKVYQDNYNDLKVRVYQDDSDLLHAIVHGTIKTSALSFTRITDDGLKWAAIEPGAINKLWTLTSQAEKDRTITNTVDTAPVQATPANLKSQVFQPQPADLKATVTQAAIARTVTNANFPNLKGQMQISDGDFIVGGIYDKNHDKFSLGTSRAVGKNTFSEEYIGDVEDEIIIEPGDGHSLLIVGVLTGSSSGGGCISLDFEGIRVWRHYLATAGNQQMSTMAIWGSDTEALILNAEGIEESAIFVLVNYRLVESV